MSGVGSILQQRVATLETRLGALAGLVPASKIEQLAALETRIAELEKRMAELEQS